MVQEETERQGSMVVLNPSGPLRPSANVRHQGEELKRGDRLLPAGKILRPADLGLLAVAGCKEVAVVRRLRVSFLATGEELADPGDQLAPGFIYESNRPVLHALLSEMGIEPIDLGRVGDDRDTIRRALLQGAGQADVLMTTGGASVGEADHVVELLRELGQVEFWKVAIKPGKPFVFGRLGSTPIFGLPGNPVSMMVTFLQLARPALLRMAGAVAMRPLRWRVTCRNRLRKSPGRLEFQRGVVDWVDGVPGVSALAGQGSHRLTSMSRADCFIVLPSESTGAEPGDMVEIELFAEPGVFPS
jgi:molybdopterin molybdotransferase